ncbi:MAG TPA: undecaprenyl-diphosphatase UppP [Brevefilum sp.]|nr:undecaprenyl-diphosphatase UppP [Brevefilum sp.]HOR19170.1 undecaprenyl-diphosphatase UppP [Brevefilum sp.]HPL69610.1 undecaprenyl-diphosphatase UppP [Brevefilum sp.]
MSVIQAVILGVIQGITEFLPISSSAHLVLLPYFLNWQLPIKETFIFNVLVQVGTLAAVIFYFRKDLAAILVDFFKQLFAGTPFATHSARMGWLLILATIPAGLAGLLFSDLVEASFTSPLVVGIALLVTAALMLLAERVSQNIGDSHDVTLMTALVMGAMQVFALVPGISRSGATISGGMLCHLRREAAGKFSFLMSIPIMLAAGALSTYKMVKEVPDLASFLPIMALGFLTALVVGYIAIRWLLKFLVRHSLAYFSAYCFLLGGVTILVWAVR